MLKKASLIGLIFVSQLLSAQPNDLSSQVGVRFANGIAAIAEDKIITTEDVKRAIQPHLEQIYQEAQNNPVQFQKLLQEAEDQIIQTLTDNVLIVKDFFEDKGMIPSSFVRNRVNETIITDFEDDRAKFLGYLKTMGKTPEEYDEIVRDEIIVNYMRGNMRKSESFISPVKIEQFYTENKQQFFQEEAIHLRLIRLAPMADEDPALLEQTAAEIIRKLDEGYDFAELAKQHSQDTKKDKGGDWGWKLRKSLKEEISDVAFELDIGEHSQPVKLGSNYFIMFVQDRREEGYVELERVRDDIEMLLVSHMAQEAEERWLERLRRDGYVRRFH